MERRMLTQHDGLLPRGLPEKGDRSVEVAALLTMSGGFLDAFTYAGHGEVFANAMTGNVVLLGVGMAAGKWAQAARHIPPIMAFGIGVFLAHMLRMPWKWLRKVARHPALTCLGLEVLFLLVSAFLPRSFPDVLLVPGISLVAAMQNSSFTRLDAWTYNSVMTTGNLRRCAEAVFESLLPRFNPLPLRQAGMFGIICASFFGGAAMGGALTQRLHNYALFVPAGLLLAALIVCWYREFRARNGAA